MYNFLHYYGDDVRRLFFLAGLGMVLLLPFLAPVLPVSSGLSIFAIVVLVFAAGYTHPRSVWFSGVDFAISVIGLTIFGTQAVADYASLGEGVVFAVLFAADLVFGVIFFLATYLSVKTFRGFLLQSPREREEFIR